MASDDDGPLFACRCLNIRLCNKGRGSHENPQQQPHASAEYQPLYVGDEGVKMSHNELTLRTRSPVVNDSTSSTGHTQQTLVTCLICDTAAYRVKAEVPPDEDAKEGPILPTEDWAERDTLRSKTGYVDVHVGKGGCITEDEIKRIMSSSSYSQYFSLNMPSESHVLSTAAPPILPQARLAIPVQHSFLPSLPPFLQPPPFTPSHPIFLHLSSIATACSNDARRDTEKHVEEFARQELTRLEEHETTLRTQLERLWWLVKEGLKKAEQERDANLLLALQSRRRSMSPRRVASPTSGGIDSAVHNFVPSTYHAPRAVHSSGARPSALSTSLATSSFHHPRAQQDANTVAVSGKHAPLTPSPPPYTYTSNSSPPGSSGSGTGSMAIASRSFKRNMDVSNDAAVTYRFYVIEEQEAARRKAKEKAGEKESEVNGTKQDGRGTNKAQSNSNGSRRPSITTPRTEVGNESSAAGDKQTSPRKKDGRRKVTFNVEPNVVTIKRDITAEAKEERVPESGEDLLFDMDGVEPGDDADRKDENPAEETSNEAKVEITFREAPERPTRSSRRHNDLKDAGLPQSFAALRPSSLPAPSNIRPPIRGRPEQRENSQPGSFRLNSSPSSKKGKEVNGQSPERRLSMEVLSPEQKNLLKLVAADAPSHRGLWKPGSDAWKIFDRNVSNSSAGGRNSVILEEDEEDDDPETPNTNGRNTEPTDSEWRHYRRPDIVGSLPIPMAPIAQQRLSGAASLQPKTLLTDRPGTLVLPLPVVAEEDESGEQRKSAAAMRKEVYAERNKVRGLDPGVLDFVADDGDDAESPDQSADVGQVSTSRSRQHALNIIRARNAVPPEGLWRSLAT